MEAYRIEDLARESGTTVRTIRGYQDRGLLPKPGRRGRANVYGPVHLARLRQIADLLERGYTLASIKELLEARDSGTGLDGVLGLADEMNQPWSSERPVRVSRAQLTAIFGGRDDNAVNEAVALGVLEAIPGAAEDDAEEFLVPSPQELTVAAELHAAGVPLPAIATHLWELRGHVEHIAERFMEFTVEYVFQRFLDHTPTDAEATEAASLVRRLRPLAQQTIDAELARAMHTLTTRMMQRHLGDGDDAPAALPTSAPAPAGPPAPAPTAGSHSADGVRQVDVRRFDGRPASVQSSGATGEGDGDQVGVLLPASTVRAVRALVGGRRASTFIAAAAEREVRARVMDSLAAEGLEDATDQGAAPPGGV
ncbi:MerR family transcriptional regulator [Streptomyces sp. SL13]|uniref:MerR family transcriptional regulator n=1 Tax=Streptantibioticus silvisoli TaxID=2705255 RepID=A0AA90H3U3_9ACTN|nr:MerR family transcriptional regulator [Streptantibioticus silvisoli]MDI5970493.1 MerR family transcriptional regulator [Streptantibioticus silvisoli]